MSSSLRILHVVHSGAIGGGPAVILNLIKGVPARHSVCTANDGPLLAEARKLGAETCALPWAGEFSFAISMPKLVAKCRQADVVHVHGQFAAFYGSHAAFFARTPMLYTAHFPSFVTDSTPSKRLRNRIAEAAPCHLARLLVSCSETMRREYVERGLVDATRAITIYNGVDELQSEVAAEVVRERLGLAYDDLVILAVGRMTKQKGFDIIVRALPIIRSEIPTTRLLLVGDGEEREALQSLACELGVESSATFTGFRSDMSDLYGAATLVAVPSRYDIFPLVPLEAMMAAKPVLASDLSVLHEAIDEGQTGCFATSDPESFARTALTMLSDPPGLLQMGHEGQRRARERFSAQRMADEYTMAYQRVLEHDA